MAGIYLGRYFEKNGLYGRLVNLIVDVNHRRQKVGKVLLKAAESWMRKEGATEIVVNSSSYRTDAHAFYEKMGYGVTGVRFVKHLTVSTSDLCSPSDLP
jgi:GNAT superfamily N-acetyltransferase